MNTKDFLYFKSLPQLHFWSSITCTNKSWLTFSSHSLSWLFTAIVISGGLSLYLAPSCTLLNFILFSLYRYRPIWNVLISVSANTLFSIYRNSSILFLLYFKRIHLETWLWGCRGLAGISIELGVFCIWNVWNDKIRAVEHVVSCISNCKTFFASFTLCVLLLVWFANIWHDLLRRK